MELNGVEKEMLRGDILACGALAAGFAKAEPIDAAEAERYARWIAAGNHARMDYLARHVPLRMDPGNVLENAATVISIAFSYVPLQWRDPSLPVIAAYAYGEDYHDVLRKLLQPVVERWKERTGGEWRICIDSAPLPERYWAMKAGLGRMGKNGSVIVENSGCYNFLVVILTPHHIAAVAVSEATCLGCGECIRRCPQQALREDGTIDSRRCLNYLTIEHRGDWDTERRSYTEMMQTEAGKHTLYGCDACLRCCPHNRGVEPSRIEAFRPKPELLALTAAEAVAMTQEDFSRLFKGSPIKRAKFAGFHRNALNLLPS